MDKAASAWFMEEYPLERVCANNSMLVRAGKENAHRAQFFAQLDATPIESNLNQYIVHENGIKLRVTQALVAVGLYKRCGTRCVSCAGDKEARHEDTACKQIL